MDNYKIARAINKCFDTSIAHQTFIVNGELLKTPDGESEFYKKSAIYKVIKKLNKLIVKLEKSK